MENFKASELKKLYKPSSNSSGEENGQVTIIGGSELFHGAPLLSLKVASRIVDMVFFASPEPGVGRVSEKIKSKLLSFLWVPWGDVEAYIEKSDAILVGPGFMRYKSEKRQVTSDKLDRAGKVTKEITERLIKKHPNKRWVIDAGSLQVMDPELLPKGCIVTPNKKEFETLFDTRVEEQGGGRAGVVVKKAAEKYNCTIVLKGPEAVICSKDECVLVKGGNPGLTKGGTGDVLAGLTVSFFAKNEASLAGAAASYIVKEAADELCKRVGVNYSADDLADKIPEVLYKHFR